MRDFEDTQMLAQLFADMLQTDEEGEHKVAWKMLGILWYVLVIFYCLPTTFLGNLLGNTAVGAFLKTPSRNPRSASRSFRICWKPINLDPTYRPGELISKCRDILQDAGGTAGRANHRCNHLCECMCSHEGRSNKYRPSDGDVHYAPDEQGTEKSFSIHVPW